MSCCCFRFALLLFFTAVVYSNFSGHVNCMYIRVNSNGHGIQLMMTRPDGTTAIGCAKICTSYVDCIFFTFQVTVSNVVCTLYQTSQAVIPVPCTSLKCFSRNQVY